MIPAPCPTARPKSSPARRWWTGFGLALLTVLSVRASVMVIAPHPDDDVIYASGVALNAVRQGVPVTVVFITNGDILGTNYGYFRQGYAVEGQVTCLGTTEDDLVFLGYPTLQLTNLWQTYTNSSDVFTNVYRQIYTNSGTVYTNTYTQSTTYGNRGLGRTDYHTYRFGTSANYNLPNLLTDLQDVIATNRPQHIYTVSEYDNHTDHKTTYRALLAVLAAIAQTDPDYRPLVHSTIVWDNSWGALWPADPNPSTYFTEPPGLTPTTLVWAARQSFDVPYAMTESNLGVNLKYKAIQNHKADPHYFDFVHRDEIFWAESPNATNPPPRAEAGPSAVAAEGEFVQLNGAASTNPSGGSLIFQWTQVSGPAVTLSDPATSAPTLTTPTGLVSSVGLDFQLTVTDEFGVTSAPDLVSVVVTSQWHGHNLTRGATATASSQEPWYGQYASSAIDGVAAGYTSNHPTSYVAASNEWATQSQGTGAWLRVNWSRLYVVDRIVLYDRPHLAEQIWGANIVFSDGSTVTVGRLHNDGAGLTITFAPRAVSNLTLTVTAVSPTSDDIGLAELEVFGRPADLAALDPVFEAAAAQGSNFVARFASVPGWQYRLEYAGSLDPAAWTNALGPYAGRDDGLTITNLSAVLHSNRFYRAVRLP